ncbi:hypothetical protein ACHAWF_006678 [Thalassiosira exigua]
MSKGAKRRKRSKHPASSRDDDAPLSDLCHCVAAEAGFGSGAGAGVGVADCLEELAAAQMGTTATGADAFSEDDRCDDVPSASSRNGSRRSDASADVGGGDAAADDRGGTGRRPSERPRASSPPPPPPPPGLDRIPHPRIELARHLHAQQLSSFLLEARPGQLRMPSFERWLLDSKLEESKRLASIAEELADDPSSRSVPKGKKRYGRAALYHKAAGGEGAPNGAREERESDRREDERKLVADAARHIPPARDGDRRGRRASLLFGGADRDPVLPRRPLESDPSSERLADEIVAAADAGGGGDDPGRLRASRAREVVSELCRRTREACRDLRLLERRLGRHHKFGWDSDGGGGRSGGGKRKRGGKGKGGKGGGCDVSVEWHEDDSTGKPRLCSLVYAPKRRRCKRAPSSTTTSMSTENAGTADEGDDAQSRRKPKPFVVKVNATHYRKLRAMFDAAYGSSGSASASPSSRTNGRFAKEQYTKEQFAHAFHVALFVTVIRYSTLSGGQLLNDFRGGGMQGAIHSGVFSCLSKWFGTNGTECFASPFNSTLSRYRSAFPSPDVDGHFGSRGDFFWSPADDEDDEFVREGWWHELNPPFAPGIMDEMADRIGRSLEAHAERGSDVTFVVVVPTVRGVAGEGAPGRKREERPDDAAPEGEREDVVRLASLVQAFASRSFRKLVESPYRASHLVLPAREHGYVEGGQHLRPTRYKESRYDTSVIVLRSGGRLGEDDAKEFEEEVREAFASRHATEVRERKEGRRKEPR